MSQAYVNRKGGLLLTNVTKNLDLLYRHELRKVGLLSSSSTEIKHFCVR